MYELAYFSAQRPAPPSRESSTTTRHRRFHVALNGLPPALLRRFTEIDYRTHVALVAEAITRLAAVPGLAVHGPLEAADRGALVSFSLDGAHPHDIGEILEKIGKHEEARICYEKSR